MTDKLQDVKLQDIPGSALQEQFKDIRARNSAQCDAEYGTRDSDNALVFHFFPPGHALDDSMDWVSWTGFRDRLEDALLAAFPPYSIDAGYVEELRSFFAIIYPRPAVPDLTALIERFFSVLEVESAEASEKLH